jgi:hypothetical protein
MTNHIRTLLLNLPSRNDGSVSSEEFIEPSFTPLHHDGREASIYRAIFTSSWPREYMNFISTLLSGVVMDSDAFQEYGAQFDKRLSYDFRENLTSDLSKVNLNVIKTFNSSSLAVSGSYSPASARGRFSNSWTLKKSTGDSLEITDDQTGEQVITSITFTSDVSDVFSLCNGLTGQLIGVSSVPANFLATVRAESKMEYSVLDLHSRLLGSTEIPTIVSLAGDGAYQYYLQLDNPIEQVAMILIGFCVSASSKISSSGETA